MASRQPWLFLINAIVFLVYFTTGSTPKTEAATINPTSVTAQAQESTTTATPSNIIIEDIVPKSVLTFIGLAIFVLIGMGIAKLVDRFHDSVELRDDASDISEHTRDLLKARFALFAFTPAKLQSEADQKARKLENARKYGRKWMIRAAMARKKKRDEIRSAILNVVNETNNMADVCRASSTSSLALSASRGVTPVPIISQGSLAETENTDQPTGALGNSKPKGDNIIENNKNTNTNVKNLEKPKDRLKSAPSEKPNGTLKASTLNPVNKMTIKAGSGVFATEKPKVTLVSYKSKEENTVDSSKKADESSTVGSKPKKFVDFIAIDFQNLDDSTETKEGSGTLSSTPRTTYIDFREVSDDITIPVRVSTDDKPRPRRTLTQETILPPPTKFAYADSEFGSSDSLRQSVAKVATPPVVVKAAPNAMPRPSEGLEITSLSRENSSESIPSNNKGAKATNGVRPKTPGAATVAAKKDNRPVTSRPMTGRVTSSRPLTAGRAQRITQGAVQGVRSGRASVPPKSASRRGR